MSNNNNILQTISNKLKIPKEIAHLGFLYVIPTLLTSITCLQFNIPVDPNISLQLTSMLGTTLQLLYSKKDIKRIEKTLQILSDKISSIVDSIDKKYVKTEEFKFLVKRTWINLADEYREEMIEAYTNMIVNFSTVSFSKKEAKEYYFNLLNGFIPLHLIVIDLLVTYFNKEGIDNNDKTISNVRNFLFDSLRGKMEDNQLGILDGIIADLIAKGILREVFLPNYNMGNQVCNIMPMAKELLSFINLQ